MHVGGVCVRYVYMVRVLCVVVCVYMHVCVYVFCVYVCVCVCVCVFEGGALAGFSPSSHDEAEQGWSLSLGDGEKKKLREGSC